MVAKVVCLRRHYHFGPFKIFMFLKRYHDIEISNSGVWRVLDRRGMGRLPANQRYKHRAQHQKHYEKPQPSHQVQIDTKVHRLIRGVTNKGHYQFTAIDDTDLFTDQPKQDQPKQDQPKQDKPKQQEHYNNFDRPHETLGGQNPYKNQTPYERLKQKTTRP